MSRNVKFALVVSVAGCATGCALSTEKGGLEPYGTKTVAILGRHYDESVSVTLDRGAPLPSDCPALDSGTRTTLNGHELRLHGAGGPKWNRVVQTCYDASFGADLGLHAGVPASSVDPMGRFIIADGSHRIEVDVPRYMGSMTMEPGASELVEVRRGTSVRFRLAGFHEYPVRSGEAYLDTSTETLRKNLTADVDGDTLVVQVPADTQRAAGATLEVRVSVDFDASRCVGAPSCTVGGGATSQRYVLDIVD